MITTKNVEHPFRSETILAWPQLWDWKDLSLQPAMNSIVECADLDLIIKWIRENRPTQSSTVPGHVDQQTCRASVSAFAKPKLE